MPPYILGAYWGSRPATVVETADRVKQFAEKLGACDPSLSTWYKPGSSRVQALKYQLDLTDINAVVRTLKRSQGTSLPPAIANSLGFRVGCWNGNSNGVEVGLSLYVGSSHTSSQAPIPNNAILRWGSGLGPMTDASRMLDVLSIVASVWNPDWAGVMSDKFTDKQNFSTQVPRLDWMLYLANGRPEHPGPFLEVGVPERGSIFTTERDHTEEQNLIGANTLH